MNTSVLAGSGCDPFCGVHGDKLDSPQWADTPARPDIRVAKAFGTKAYDMIRVSVVSNSRRAGEDSDDFDYAAPFKFKWEDNYLQTKLLQVRTGTPVQLHVGSADITVKLPVQGGGVAGVLIADPCVTSKRGWIGCDFGNKLNTAERTPGLINAFVADPAIDFWGIIGDNFYDRTGEITKPIFSAISVVAKSKILVTVPGNHDYWVLGGPDVGTKEDQCGNGFMQFYAQDSKAAQDIQPGDSSPPFNFSIVPDASNHDSCHVAAMDNFFWYNQVGNVGLIGQSGAYPLEEARPFMQEACAWLGQQPGLKVGVLLGHWDIGGSGAPNEMAMPEWYEEMSALPGCAEFEKRGMLKFVMGHTHCNDPHPHGKVGAGFRVAGFGMGGCGNYGMPIVDTSEDRVRFWYFDTVSEKQYGEVISCVQQKGWRSCTHMATLWLDEPLAG
eukprot:CAMPEP_0178419796 /NCGR_PEP_ID=MMETSP0689_2-20121128/25796_1 /TAXON_ID=160604 /ORGANISM="Amphidinium massartii, Strain CS-259" /LENGTH=440 /DNA_ID=CAMNT_0020041247 /DNA_START=86 /DNA_END=1405 /DNA_ORIENTATION=-